MKTAILLSGGMDSIAIAFWQRPELAITVDYGQEPAAGEIRAAEAVCDVLQIEHVIVRANLASLGSGDMAGSEALSVAPVPEWWPYRNQMLVTLGAMRAITLNVQRLLIGCLSTDRAHADGRAEFVSALDAVLRLQEGELRLEAPAIDLTATQLIEKSGISIDVLAWAHSCHTSAHACGICRGCRKHYETMEALGYPPY